MESHEGRNQGPIYEVPSERRAEDYGAQTQLSGHVSIVLQVLSPTRHGFDADSNASTL
jgi:hypothetical protein